MAMLKEFNEAGGSESVSTKSSKKSSFLSRLLKKRNAKNLLEFEASPSVPQRNPHRQCPECFNIKLGNLYPSTHHTQYTLRESAINGCPSCQYFRKHLPVHDSSRSAEVTVDLGSNTLRYRVPSDGGGRQIVFEIIKTGCDSMIRTPSDYS